MRRVTFARGQTEFLAARFINQTLAAYASIA